ncbi:MAG: amino acid permease [Acidimicrobiales bacterium]
MGGVEHGHLRRSLTLRHVFALSSGAMISSGLFLLPGLAVAKGGPSAILAYTIAGLLAIPAMLSVAELATAMPKAGGAYYFLERALGPAVGTVAGMSTWLSLVLKDAFALIGMSAYLNLIVDVPNKPLALALIAVFTALNVFGSKTSASVQLALVAFVLLSMGMFLLAGLPRVSSGSGPGSLDPFFTSGFTGFVSVIGLVFVSYGGLTKVASVAEEIEDPSRNIPLGMALSLLVSTTLYTLAVLVAVAVVPIDRLTDDLVPIDTAAEAVLPPIGVVLVVMAALAAFSSAVNAGILAAGRYPLAMSRDRLLGPQFQRVSSRNTPVAGIVVTGLAMGVVVAAFDVGAIAKLASAFVLATLGLVNLAVLVLRAAKIRSYAPGFKAPFYPFLQFAGIGIALFLIIELGLLALLMVTGAILVALVWYAVYGRSRTTSAGAIYHVFERWGRSADRNLEREISAAMQSHGLRAQDEYPGLIASAAVISLPDGESFGEAVHRSSEVLGRRLGLEPALVTEQFVESGSLWIQPSERHPTATPIAFFEADEEHLIIVRSTAGIRIPARWGGKGETVNALFFLAGCINNAGRGLRLAGELAAYIHSDTGLSMIDATFESEVKSALLPELDIAQYTLLAEVPAGQLIGLRIGDLAPPEEVHLEAVRREGRVLRTNDDLVLQADDQLTVIGPSNGLPEADELHGVLSPT